MKAWIKPVTCAFLVALAVVPFGVEAIPRSEKDVDLAAVPAALFVLPFILTPIGVVALLVGAVSCVRPAWREAGFSCVRFGASLLVIGTLSGWVLLPLLS